ncbi:hypothetical protein D6779_02825, partial [Candidatus Parcubacteria bacterium]
YSQDWNDRAQKEFDGICEKLKSRGDLVFELPSGQITDLEKKLREERKKGAQYTAGSLRNQRYALCSSYIARHAHILVAFWDGEKKETEGGTCWTILDFARGQSLAEYRKHHTGACFEDTLIPDFPLLRRHGLGAIWHIPAPRNQDSQQAGEPANPTWLDGELKPDGNDANTPPSRLGFLDNIDRFNEESALVPADDRQLSLQYLSLASPPDLSKGDNSDPTPSPSVPYRHHHSKTNDAGLNLTALSGIFASADAMAVDYRDIAFWRFLKLGATLFLAVLAFKSADQLNAHRGVLGAIFVLLLAIMIFLQWRFARDRKHIRHLEYRVLAEGIRVQIAWAVAGLQSCVCDAYPFKHLDGASWIWHAMRGLHAGLLPDPARTGHVENINHVRNAWIEDQEKYLQQKIETFRVRKNPDSRWRPKLEGLAPMLRFFRAARLVMLGLGGLALAYKGLVDFLPVIADVLPTLTRPNSHLPATPGWALFVLGVLPLTIAFILNQGMHVLALEQELEWYAASHHAYCQANQALQEMLQPAQDKEQLPDASSRERVAALILALGRAALHESSVWIDLHKKRDVIKSLKPET